MSSFHRVALGKHHWKSSSIHCWQHSAFYPSKCLDFSFRERNLSTSQFGTPMPARIKKKKKELERVKVVKKWKRRRTEMKWVVFWQTLAWQTHISGPLHPIFLSTFYASSLSFTFCYFSLSRSLLSHWGFRSICSRGVIYSLRGNKGISHISLIFTLHNSTFLSVSLSISLLSSLFQQESVHG